ncbi:hypothetical protein GO993_06400 [Aeromonas salmonicida subsp. salmonicida]|uniref:hypothetical protein n=1 Tax=Aeromonas salmonicida TaxID=645 RepID=UPI00131F5660|nr:hypothetical protein [Aeromonas salmonicida]QHE47737.1 hypothetical protein GO994_10895 [Aeromonas salmonicida subsp. salmonicida]QJF55418.1 hypothetical protein GO993_06400 [Aeromonas salmonicida subsp. salmonicida]
MKRFTHDADLRGMVVLRSLGFQLVPFKLHRFRKQRPTQAVNGYCMKNSETWLLSQRKIMGCEVMLPVHLITKQSVSIQGTTPPT